MLISEVMEKWLESSRGKRHPNTLKMHYEPFVKAYLEMVGDHPIEDFKIHHVDQFIESLRVMDLGLVTVNMKLQRLITFLNWARDRDYSPNVPRIRKLREPKKLPMILNLGELESLFIRIGKLRETAPTDYLRRCFLIHERALMLFLGTGMRRSEVFYLTWNQVDFGRLCITVKHQERMGFVVKEKKEKRVELPDYLNAYLFSQRQKYPRESYVLDNGQGEMLYSDPYSLTKVFRRHYNALGWQLRGIKPLHGFRALFIDRLFNHLEIDIELVRAMVGHSDVRVTRLYLPETDKRHKKIAKQLGEFDESKLAEVCTLARLRSTN